MASAELIVAKTALSGALFRADPRPCSRDDIESMLALLSSTIAECSRRNVQRCKQWALSNLVPSSARVGPFCKYLVALAKSFGAEKEAAALESKRGRVPSAKRRRLHVLYILNDILYHVKHRNGDDAFAQKLEPALPALVRSAASFNNCPKHIHKIHDLIGLWEENGYFSQAFVEQLRAALNEGPSVEEGTQNDSGADNSARAVAKAAKTAPWVIPAMHGDPSIPWYDLPAANWLPVLEPNSTRPIKPSMIKPLVLAQGPADKALVAAVKTLLADVDRIYSKETQLDEPPANIGRLGERVEMDEITGEIIGGDTYYGWSRAFCEKMKRRGRDRAGRNHSEERRGSRRSSRSRSYSRSESRSRSRRRDRSDASSRSPARHAAKRQRLSRSPQDRDRGRSRSRSGSRYPNVLRRSRSSPRSRSRTRTRPQSGSRSRSRSRSRFRSPARSRARQRRSPSYDEHGRYRPRSPDFSRSSSRGRSWSRSCSPRVPSGGPPQSSPNRRFVPPNPSPGVWNPHHPAAPPPPPPMTFPIPPVLAQPGFAAAFPVPPPPPPPPNYQGPWPPVPPPLPPPAGQQPNFFAGRNALPPPPFVGGWPPPPPPPPPPAPEQRGGFHHQGSHQGPGYSRGGWR